MTKTDIIKKMAANETENTALTQVQAGEILNAVLSIIMEGLKEDGVVQITGFGTFKSRKVPAYEAHNPSNPKEKIKVPTRVRASFTPGAKLKEYLN